MNRRAALLVALIAGAPAAARAQPPDPAEQAFREGRQLMIKGRFKEACPRFEESQRLDPAPGTLLNLADCYQQLGRTATAWTTFREAETAAVKSGQTDFAGEARKRAAALLPRLCKLAITSGVQPDGFAVTLDGKPVTEQLGASEPIDPGSHEIAASAPGHRRWSKQVRVDQPGETVTAEVPPLVAIRKQPVAQVQRPQPRARPATGPRHQMTPLAWGFAIGGGVALSVGVGLDVAAYRDLRRCRDRGGCESQGEVDGIKNRLVAGDVLIGAAIASAGAAFVSYWLGGSKGESSVDVVATPESASLLLLGRF